jgi:hypothetical protein
VDNKPPPKEVRPAFAPDDTEPRAPGTQSKLAHRLLSSDTLEGVARAAIQLGLSPNEVMMAVWLFRDTCAEHIERAELPLIYDHDPEWSALFVAPVDLEFAEARYLTAMDMVWNGPRSQVPEP